MPTLYIVATPIGNLEDISLRAIKTLRQVKLIAAEDTRRAKRLLNAYDIKTPLTSYYEYNKKLKLNYILKQLEEMDVALVSEAGMPAISDPGYELVVAASQQGIPVVPIPGPSAIITSLAVSGLPTDRFVYIGFLPRKSGERRRKLQSVIDEAGTIIALEAPHRLQAALDDIKSVLGDRKITVCRQLTKLHEEIFRGTVSRAQAYFKQPRGEFTLVMEGCKDKERSALTEEVLQQLREMKIEGKKAKEAIAQAALETGLTHKELYRTWLKL
jgi:16S rRNA (cytidine1402-2'-O)-methyltransferase